MFAEWKEVEIPAELTWIEEAYQNENCIITKFDMSGEKIEIQFPDGTVVWFEYDENLWNKLKENENTDWIFVSKLMTEYEPIKVGM